MEKYKDENWLRNELNKGRGYTDIAKQFNVDLTTIRYFVKKFNLKLKKTVKYPIKSFKCPVCGKDFKKRVTKQSQQVYCSSECAYKGRAQRLTIMPLRKKNASNIPDKTLKKILKSKIEANDKVKLLNELESKFFRGKLHKNSKRVYPYWKICEACNKPFMTHNHTQAKRNKICKDKKCFKYTLQKRPKKGVTYLITKECPICGKEFETRKSRPSTYCSRSCGSKSELVKEHLRNICKLGIEAQKTDYHIERRRQLMLGERNPSWKGGVTYKRPKGNYKGAKYVKCPKEYISMARKDGYVMEHRLVMAQHLERPLKRVEVVHHIDHNPLNNNIENLMLFANNSLHKKYESANPIKKDVIYKE